MKITLTEKAVEFLKSFTPEMRKLDDGTEEILLTEEDQLLFRVGIPAYIFIIGFESPSEVTANDAIIHEDKGLKVICDDYVFEALKGCTIDHELFGLGDKLVFKSPEFSRTYCVGEKHPAAKV